MKYFFYITYFVTCLFLGFPFYAIFRIIIIK